MLEQHLRRYSCLTLGDQLEIQLAGIVFTLTVTSLEPAEAVSIVNIDLTIDIEWDEPEQPKLSASDQTQPDFDWQPGLLQFSRREKRPSRKEQEPEQAKIPKFPGEGSRLGGVRTQEADSSRVDEEQINEPSDEEMSE